MNIDRYEALTLEYRANANSTVLILRQHTRLLESQSQNQSVVAVVKFVRSPSENNKRAICKRASVGQERQSAIYIYIYIERERGEGREQEREREGKIERASERSGGWVGWFTFSRLKC